MINNYQLVFLIISGGFILLSQLIDFYAYFIKHDYLSFGETEYLSVVNWVQYIGRIFVMIGVFFISFMAESGISPVKLEIMFTLTIFLSGLFILLCIRWRWLVVIPYLVQKIGCLNMFEEYGSKFYWSRIEKFKLGKLFYISTLVNVILVLAMITPIFAQKANPSFRMTFAYAGQGLNFLASIIIFVYIDRILYSTQSNKSLSPLTKVSQIIYGKVASLFLVPLIVIAFIL